MKRSKYRLSQLSRIVLLLLAMAMLIPVGDAYGKKKKKKKKRPSLNVEFSLSTIYDDNILKYSDKYLERFENSEDEGRFQIKTHDDVVLYPNLSLSSTMKIFGKKKSTFNLGVSRREYLNNDIKSWNYITMGYRQYLTKKLSFKLYYSHIPDFYINNFRDDDWKAIYGYDPISFKPYAFAKDNYGVWAQNTFFKKTRVRLGFTFTKYFHNEHFTEYDCDNYVYSAKVTQPITKKLSVAVGYQYTLSDAQGYDEPGETLETSDDSDANHEEDRFSIELMYKFPKIKKYKSDLDIECRIQNRYYDSHHFVENDLIHAGREDNNIRLYFTYNFQVNKKFKVAAFYYWFKRETTTSSALNRELVADEKSYEQNQVGIKLSYKFKI